MSSFSRRVSQEPYATVARMSGLACRSTDFRLMVPPNVDWPTVVASPGLRSKSVDPIHSEGKFAQVWCDTLLVSVNGMPSQVTLYSPSERPRKYVLPWPSPAPLGLSVKVPGE